MIRIRQCDLLDGTGLRRGVTIRIADGRIIRLATDTPRPDAPLICPGLVDLQVNGGGGHMLGECQTVAQVRDIVRAQCRLGTTQLLLTLISDSRDTTLRIIDLVARAQKAVPTLLGLHLEGPHLWIAGAHSASRLRPMTDQDVSNYLNAKSRLGHLMITLAPEVVTLKQITALAKAGIIVALGHSGCSYQAGCDAFAAGARMVTHLFNAMSGLHHREPGLAGAALDRAEAFGLIADGHHVHPAVLRLALRSRPEAAILVSDAMALAGTGQTGFALDGRRITRAGGRLTLANGTLAGADISLLDGARRLARVMGVPLDQTLPHAFAAPLRLLTGQVPQIREGDDATFLMIKGTAATLFLRGTPRPIDR
ncbi:MAG: N-acetylglucosamine-6-phosphate deacetylase [Rhodobacteraceae bacterium]|nr:N-acetylglucosamine-6-phosphate deacetylase [Paracoccaceae bacterium]